MCKFLTYKKYITINLKNKQSHTSFYLKFQFETEAQIYDQCKKCAGKMCQKSIYKLLGLNYAHFECIQNRKVDSEERADHDIGHSSNIEPSGSNDQAKINESTGQCKL